ncbi:MAG: 2-oxo acid dehydrogenase subunit E2 [Pseudomonadales bacterium]|nr:2-oxo acid dehydrogenase subunit E2 [Pseudomonadales bacterium]
MTEQVLVPDVGQAQDVEVIEILVAPGDRMEKDTSLIVLESDKASMEIPSPKAGTIVSISMAVGDTVDEGDLILEMETASDATEVEAAPVIAAEPAVPQQSEQTSEVPKSSPPPASEVQTAPVASVSQTSVQAPQAPPAADVLVHAGPAVRKQAREYGVELAAVKGSGREGRILKDDIQQYVANRLGDDSGGGIPKVPEVDFGKFGEIDLKPLPKIRQASARNLHRSWLNIPHVTQFDEADVTELEAFRKQQNTENVDVKLTPLAFLVKACVAALQKYPNFNASIQADYQHLIVKKYYNIGIAVETDDGLMVPVLKDADKKGVLQLAEESAMLAAAARDKKLPFDAMQGATFTISSLGGIGGTAFTPIVNAPEVAILGVSRSKVVPVYNGEAFEPRTMLPLSLSYDHRAIDGAEAARFTQFLAQIIGDIRMLIL